MVLLWYYYGIIIEGKVAEEVTHSISILLMITKKKDKHHKMLVEYVNFVLYLQINLVCKRLHKLPLQHK